MSYLVLARKYRPQTFDQLVGQEHVTRTLINALEAQRTGHAYIFSGPRGCGKTTTARLLAKALNCDKGPTPVPCNECPACREISEGASADDVLEIDGASNRGIDQIRELRDTVKYSPARSRYRIVIIDEAHQITDAGFNALLKTLEEPPPHAVFMMATTEARKIPATILSRCQRFHLKSISPADTVAQIKKILAAENVKAEEEALFDVARAAHGGLRDALSLLDQVISYSPAGVTTQGIRDLLGLLPREKIRSFAAVLREGDPAKTLQAVQLSLDEGFELGQLARDLTDHFHQLLLWKNGVRAEETSDAASLEKEGALYEEEDLERALDILTRTSDRLRRSESPRATFELACLDLTRKALPLEELLDRLEDLETRLSSGTPAPVLPVKKKIDPPVTPEAATPELRDNGRTPPRRTNEGEGTPGIGRTIADAGPATPPVQAAAPAPPPVEKPKIAPGPVSLRDWPKVLDAVGSQKPSLEPFLRAAHPELSSEGALRLLCKDEFQRTQISLHLALLTSLVQSHLGPLPVSCSLGLPKAGSPAPAPAARIDPPLETAEEASDEEDAPPVDEDPGEDSPPARTGPPPADQEMADTSSADADAGEVAALEPGLKKVLDRFPGKLKRLDPLP